MNIPPDVPDFQTSFDQERGMQFLESRAYWLGQCSELIYPCTTEEKEADRKAREVTVAERTKKPSARFSWRSDASDFVIEQLRSNAIDAIGRAGETECARIESRLSAWGFNQYQFLSGISTQCFVAASDALVVVCFRGTEMNRLRDLYDDLMVKPVSYPDGPGLIHYGFWSALRQVWRDDDSLPLAWPKEADREVGKGLVNCLRDFRNNDKPQLVWITGHSLGGALATMAAARLVREGVLDADEIGGVYTFGQPRVGDPEFANDYALADRHFRVVHSNDIVTRVPPESVRQVTDWLSSFGKKRVNASVSLNWISRLKYHHVGKFVFLHDEAPINLGLSKWQLFKLRLRSRAKALFAKGSLAQRFAPDLSDHAMSKYVSLLTIAATRRQ